MRDSKTSPALPDAIDEVQGNFPNDASLQDAMTRLTVAGFDRADISLPHPDHAATGATPNEGADNPTDSEDRSQLRTMGASMAGFAGAAAIAGATIATGGAAGVAIAAAAAVGIGSGLAANAAGHAADNAVVEDRDERGSAGKLILAVRIRKPEQIQTATALMEQAGGSHVGPVRRSAEQAGGVNAASWTG